MTLRVELYSCAVKVRQVSSSNEIDYFLFFSGKFDNFVYRCQMVQKKSFFPEICWPRVRSVQYRKLYLTREVSSCDLKALKRGKRLFGKVVA